MITMFAARLFCGLAVLAPVVLALQPTRAGAQAQLAPVQRAPTYERQQKKINAWTVGFTVGADQVGKHHRDLAALGALARPRLRADNGLRYRLSGPRKLGDCCKDYPPMPE